MVIINCPAPRPEVWRVLVYSAVLVLFFAILWKITLEYFTTGRLTKAGGGLGTLPPIDSITVSETQDFLFNEQAFEDKSLEYEALTSAILAREMVRVGKIDKAHKLFEHALALAPKHPDILNSYGEFLEANQADLIQADHLYHRAIMFSPDHSNAKSNIVRTGAAVEEMDKATLDRIDNKRDALTKIPDSHPALRKVKKESYFHHIYHSAGIEGNTFTLAQTRSVVETNIAVGGKSIVEHSEILGLDAALKFINTTLINRERGISLKDILEIHKNVMGFVDPMFRGTFRSTQVFVGNHIPPAPSDIEPLMKEFETWLNSYEALTLHPVKYAALAHYKLVYIHPFKDGNGRTSRLLMNLILMKHGFPPVIIMKQDRYRYYRMLELANEGDVRPFIRFIGECTERTLDLFLWSTSEYSEKKLPAYGNDISVHK